MTISYTYTTTSSVTATNSTVEAYKTANRFKIGGKYDLPLTNIGNLLTKSDYQLQSLRSARITELGKLNSLPTSGLSTDEQNKESALARIAFAQTSTRLIKDTKDDNTAKAGIAAANYTLKDISQAVTDYTKAKAAGTTTAADDAKFISNVKALASSYSSIVSNLHSRLAGEGVSYSLNYNQAKKYLAAINTGLAALQAPAAAPAPENTTPVDTTPPADNDPVSTADDPSVVPVSTSADNPQAVDLSV